jgi:hypothetical protein
MPSDITVDLKTTWPWGRQAPLKRLDDLDRRRADALDKKRRLEELFKERLIDVDRVLEGIDADIALAQKCEEDRCRRAVKNAVQALEKRGIALPKDFEKRKPDQSLLDELAMKLKGAPGLDPVVELEDAEAPITGGAVGFEEMSGLARGQKLKGTKHHG